MQLRANGKGWRRGLLAAALGLALVLAPGLLLAQSLIVDVNPPYSNSPYNVVGDITNDGVIVGFSNAGVLNQSGFTNTVTVDLTLGAYAGTAAPII